MHAPAVRRAFPVKQIRPFRRVGNVIALGIAVTAEIVGDFDVQRAVVVGETLEGDAEVLAHDAAGALAADQIAALDRLLLASGIIHACRDAVGILLERDEFRRQAQVDVGMRLGHLERLLDDLDALALQNVGKTRVVFQMDVIERGDQLAFMAVPVMKHRRDDAARLELLIKPEPVEHFQGGRMVGAGARHLFEEIIVAERLDQADLLIRLRQCQ